MAWAATPHAYMNHHFTAEELAGKPEPDQHWHEHATCFSLGDRGLVVISSCGHAGIINTLRRAQEVSGVEKIYALVGGFHLAPAPDDYLRQVMGELKKFDLEHVMPMHCSGQNFIDLAKQGDAGETGALRDRQQLHVYRLARQHRRGGSGGPLGRLLTTRNWLARRRGRQRWGMAVVHPTEPIPRRIANGRCGATARAQPITAGWLIRAANGLSPPQWNLKMRTLRDIAGHVKLTGRPTSAHLRQTDGHNGAGLRSIRRAGS